MHSPCGMNVALLLVDLQRDFLERPGLIPPAGQVVESAAALLQEFRHHACPVLHLRTSVSRSQDNRMPHWREADLWFCEEGSPGVQPPRELVEREGEPVLFKSGFVADSLETALAPLRPDLVVLAGVMLPVCVREAALALHSAGYRVCVAEEATGGDDPVHASSTRRFLEERGVRFLAARQIGDGLRDGRLLDEGGDADCERVSATITEMRSERKPGERGGEGLSTLLRDLADRLDSEAQSLANLLAEHLGKPVRFGRAEVRQSAEMLRAIDRRLSGAAGWNRGEGEVRVRRCPLGLVAVVTPWNNPLYLPLGKIAPALLLGNSVIWKPSPKVEPVSRELERLLRKCGWPVSLVRRIEGDGRVARELVRADGIDGVTFTGSLAAGMDSAEACLRRYVPLQAEMGGNNAAIVWKDADLPPAAAAIVAGAFDQAGQRCTANRRVIVEESIYEEFLDLLISETAQLSWGDPFEEETRVGPLIDEEARGRIEGMVQRTVDSGCCDAIRPLGDAPTEINIARRAWYPPTILPVRKQLGEAVEEESFGPVLVVQTASHWAEAMERANGVRQGLAAAVFTQSPERIDRFLEDARAGLLKVNESTADAAIDVPFGGWKASGLGPAEHGDADWEFYTRFQSVYGWPESHPEK